MQESLKYLFVEENYLSIYEVGLCEKQLLCVGRFEI